MGFGDPAQQEHMRRGVKAAFMSPRTPPHLRPHLAKRLANPLGDPMQMATQLLKGADLMKPIKTVVPKGPAQKSKVVIGRVGPNGPLPSVGRAPLSGTGPVATRNPIGRDGNLGKSATPMPPPAAGPANPVLDLKSSGGGSGILSGGMGQTGMLPKERKAIFAKSKRGAFFGG